MKVTDLLALLMRSDIPTDAEIRIGDQIESGPYLHAEVISVFKGNDGDIIFCPSDNAQWTDEQAKPGKGDVDLDLIWAPPDDNGF